MKTTGTEHSNTRSEVGLVIGKFLPFHRGHKRLIEIAENESDQLVVVIVDASWHEIPFATRAEWILASFPRANVVKIDQDDVALADEDAVGWARETVTAAGMRPDVVFTSEPDYELWAQLMGARHRLVDPERVTVPISGTEIRSNPDLHLDFLEPEVRLYFQEAG